MSSIDATSDEIVAKYTGPKGVLVDPDDPSKGIDGEPRGAAGAPARDLTENDIARLAYHRAIDEVGDLVGRPIDPEDPEKGVHERPDPLKPKAATVKAILAELEASDRYRIVKREKTAKDDDASNDTKTDSPPATAAPDSAATTAEKPEA